MITSKSFVSPAQVIEIRYTRILRWGLEALELLMSWFAWYIGVSQASCTLPTSQFELCVHGRYKKDIALAAAFHITSSIDKIPFFMCCK